MSNALISPIHKHKKYQQTTEIPKSIQSKLPIPRHIPPAWFEGRGTSNNGFLRLPEASPSSGRSSDVRDVRCVGDLGDAPTPRRRNQKAELRITPKALLMVSRKLIHPKRSPRSPQLGVWATRIFRGKSCQATVGIYPGSKQQMWNNQVIGSWL